MKVEVAVLGSPSLIVPTVSVGVKQHWTNVSELSCVKVEVAVLVSPSLTVLMVSVDVKQHWTNVSELSCVKVEVAVLVSPSLTVLMVSVGVKQHWTCGQLSHCIVCGCNKVWTCERTLNRTADKAGKSQQHAQLQNGKAKRPERLVQARNGRPL